MKDSFAEINIVPLVDIMLVLVVIVLITANFVARGSISVNLPKSETEQHAPDGTLRVEMALDGTLLLDGIKITRDELIRVLQPENKNTPVLISADRDLTLQPFISMVDLLKKMGFSKISVHTVK